MLLSDESLEALRQRLVFSRVNANQGVVTLLIEKCREKSTDPDVINALGLLNSYVNMVNTLSNDLEHMLEDREHIARLLEVYTELEKYV